MELIMINFIGIIITFALYEILDKRFFITIKINESLLQLISVNPLIVIFTFLAVASVGLSTIGDSLKLPTMLIQFANGTFLGIAGGLVDGLYKLKL